jgi:hypothetical protein
MPRYPQHIKEFLAIKFAFEIQAALVFADMVFGVLAIRGPENK